ncbi:DUF4262 domain-containing protein [Glutamicibacter arilaitensis]|uniref:DUF4262 domain-containing protein n=1 Tax=Glutamicibacter arilaitensis TaxID=256701 RepID=UPI00384D94B2
MTRKQFEARTAQRILDYGREIIYAEGDDCTEPYAYTVGLSKIGHPEFLVRGLSTEDSMQMLNGFSASVLDQHEKFSHGHSSCWKDGSLLVFSCISSGIRLQVPYAYRRYGEAVRVLEIVFAGEGFPPGALRANLN